MNKRPEDDLWTPRTVEETQAIYRRWAKEYDSDVLNWGYATPTRVARALRAAGADVNQPILDFGCGTGLSGQALAAEGFNLVDGTDISPEMLAKAKERDLYRSIWLGQPGKCDEVRPGDYAGIVATGVVSMGAAPPETLALLISLLAPGNLLAFSYNDATLADSGYMAALDSACKTDGVALAFEEHGPHLPELKAESTVYVLQRT